MAHRLLKVKAIYEYTSQHEDDLHFSCGQVITITGEEDDEWYSGEYIDESGIQHKGIFPKNFVENHEPVAPPRPNRIIHLNETQSTAEPSSQLTPLTAENSPAMVEPLPIPTEKICDMRDPTSQPLTTDCSASLSKSHPGKTSQSQSPPQNTKLHSVTSAPSQPSEKPVSNTLKDRIAAFNKAATPVIPFKQPGLTSRSANNFIKKPFVAPPPSKNAFVPLPKDQSIQRVYRREEEKEFSTKTSENKENSDRPLLATGENLIEEEPPKQTSLKERIALLQKQQLEQASRLSDLNYKKDKSKRNNKKHTDINANTDHEDGNEILNERNKDCDAPRKISIDLEKEEPSNLTCQKLVGTDPETCGANYTKPMKGATEVSSSINEETRDNEGKNIKLESQTGILDEQSSSISQCEYEPQQKNIIETTSISDDNDSDDGNHDDDDDYEDAEVDLEIKRKEELRARIAKMTPRGPPNPLQFVSSSRLSMDMPRSAPPPPPNNNPASWDQNDDEHNSQRYTVPKKRAPSVPSMIDPSFRLEGPEYDLYSASPPRSPYGVQERNFSQYPQRDPITPAGARALPRKSIEISRSTTTTRRSTDITRISLDSGFVANDIDLAPMSFWWTQLNGIPAALQGKKDILFESEEKTSYQGGKTMIKKEIYVLFQDYSQTILSAYFDSQNPADVKLEQTHEQPPSRLRQDQLEQAHENLGRRIYDEIITRKDSIVGDGTPHGLITELLKPLPNVLHPVGSRAYGALIYGNIANASVQQRDEIRPGDIITFRNSKFQGKHGPLNAKYSIEVGKPEHVGIVAEWDGTKKKIRAWEQGRESKKVKLESFKLEDLRSGEVKVWRVMPRSWVGWIVDK
ncbi:SH3 domain-containing protein/hypothetical protein [Blumeria hordei DH14]|uniref:SH3 domain-containing protein n=1 Tax=Blumeria graminis f. sp. hordei (strain DH14) TaxID=546991 RepID=N1J5J0_BLUG1|nr:SH3 domain-containing protein/hypothetical protein [Blumeria hordei DH14]